MIKLIATDIDGTILKDDFTFSDGVKKCIKTLKENGIHVIIATGRMYSSTKIISNELGLEEPVISYQGALVKNTAGDEEVIYQKNVDVKTAKEIIAWAKENNIHINLYDKDILYVENDDYIVQRYSNERYTKYQIKPFDELELTQIHKLLAIDFNNPDKVTQWKNEMSAKYPNLHIVKSTPYFCEFSNCDATKGKALTYLCDLWGIKQEEVLCIGDQDNDLELLSAGGVKVAMGNGTQNLKNIADFVTDTVDNDGFVKAVNKFIL